MNDKKDWIYTTNIYEVNLRQYTPEGTFAAFEAHLPRLKNMGVETLWLMPVTPIAQKNKKGLMGSYYACSDYTSVNPEFGTLDEFKFFVEKAHGMGFKIILDWVANHTGWDHKWTIEHPDWYKREEDGSFKKASGMDDIIELDYSNNYMRRAMTDAMRFWVTECDIDGFRCDLAFWVDVNFWLEAIPQVNEEKPLFWLAESDALDHPEYMPVFDAAYTWRWMHKTEDYYKKGLPLSMLKKILDDYQSAPGLQAWFTSNHDENTWNGTEYEKYGGLAKPLAVLGCTMPGVPLMYSGQEIPNHKRLAFFEKDEIGWADPIELHGFYQALLQLRSTHPALQAKAGIRMLSTSAEEEVVAYVRKAGSGEVVVLLNFSNRPVDVTIHDPVDGTFSLLFWEVETDFSVYKTFHLNPYDFLVYVKNVQ
jgi:alpha-amylase